jgi:hypothetical protein
MHCSYEIDNRTKPVYRQKGSAFSEVGEHWMEKYFDFLFSLKGSRVGPYIIIAFITILVLE